MSEPAELSLERIEAAPPLIDPVFLDTPQYEDPQLGAELEREVVVKVETANPLGSFKGRGAHLLAAGLEPGTELVCATAGNFGQGLAHAGRARGLGVRVFASAAIEPAKRARIEAFGARLTIVDGDGERAKLAAREHADAAPGRLLIEDGRQAAIAEGAGTIGAELLAAGPFEAIAVQVGDGALITGVARWVKHHAPETRIVGVCPSGAPAMALSWRAGEPVAAPTETVAQTIATGAPLPESVARMRGLVDDFVLVDDGELRDAVALVARTLGLLLEPAGAAGIAAIRRHGLGAGRVAALLTGHGAGLGERPLA